MTNKTTFDFEGPSIFDATKLNSSDQSDLARTTSYITGEVVDPNAITIIDDMHSREAQGPVDEGGIVLSAARRKATDN